MGVRLSEAAIPRVDLAATLANLKKRMKKEKYRVSSLPFPAGGHAAYTKKWRDEFKPTLIHWAATQADPFGTNAVMLEVVEEIWAKVYPDLGLTDEDRNQERPLKIILDVVRSILF
jgi:hypothetical protein